MNNATLENKATCGIDNPSGEPVNQISATGTDIDDVFYGDQTDNLLCDTEFSNKQYDRYVGKFYNEGFREALSFLEDEAGGDTSSSKDEHVLQISFDKGYESAFEISKQLSTLSNAIRTYLELSKNAPKTILNAELSDIEKLCADLEEAKLKLGELVNGGAIASTTNNDTREDTKEPNMSIQQKLANIDENWHSKLSEIIYLPDLQKKCQLFLDLDM